MRTWKAVTSTDALSPPDGRYVLNTSYAVTRFQRYRLASDRDGWESISDQGLDVFRKRQSATEWFSIANLSLHISQDLPPFCNGLLDVWDAVWSTDGKAIFLYTRGSDWKVALEHHIARPGDWQREGFLNIRERNLVSQSA